MSAHVPDDILHDFISGEVDEQVAIHVALHLDACPRCATRAAHLEPLAQAFAAVDDPLVPDSLVEDVLHVVQAEDRRRLPALELAIGAALLAVAAVLVALGSDPVSLVADSIGTLPRLGTVLTLASTSLVALALTLSLLIVGSSLALRRSIWRNS